MTQAQYQAWRGGAVGMTDAERQAMFARAGVDASALGQPVAPGSTLSPSEIADAQAAVGASPARQERIAMAAGAPATRFIDGQGYMPMGRPAYGSAMSGASDDVVGTGRQTFGIGASGGMGSGVMRGRLPASMENPQVAARTPMAGGGGQPGVAEGLALPPQTAPSGAMPGSPLPVEPLLEQQTTQTQAANLFEMTAPQ
jgi:hypothetical protein